MTHPAADTDRHETVPAACRQDRYRTVPAACNPLQLLRLQTTAGLGIPRTRYQGQDLPPPDPALTIATHAGELPQYLTVGGSGSMLVSRQFKFYEDADL